MSALNSTAIEHAARASYEYEGDRKMIAYAGWDAEPEDIRQPWRDSIAIVVEAYISAPMPDPMLDLVTAYFTACDDLANSPLRGGDDDDDVVDAFCLERIDPLDEAIKAGTVVATREGATAALRLAERQCDEGNADLATPLMAAVRGFLEGGPD